MSPINLPTFLDRGTAGCATADPELFYGTATEQAQAKATCLGCPLRADCLADALDRGERFGVWGGLTTKERSRLARGDGRWVDDEGRVRLACGTLPALQAHRAYGETCEACTAAQDARIEADRRRRLRKEHAKGGTVNGYLIHRLLGEDACPACLGAQARRSAEQREQRAARKAADRAAEVVPLAPRRPARVRRMQAAS
ncbi:WhiB family transcriptional regulator [Streptomyces sp. Pv4-95]|uniref:WhiB family transcriptional regulator n=1 Tax=Streptomyces sp. Pv4-95 TaxID=3049543 RepID=UPI003892C91E